MPTRLGLVVQPGVASGDGVATDLASLHDAGTRGGVLRVSESAGDLLSLGRYHVVPPARSATVGLTRRLTGGRVVPAGAGFVGVSLVLPHRAALVAPDPRALRPEQVMNRYVRGILEGLKEAGVGAFYPGRDTITVDGRVLGLVSFEVDARGALLFEAILARSRDFACLAERLEAADPGGVVRAAMLMPDETTSLARVLDREPSLDEVAAWVRRGYERVFAVRVEDDGDRPRDEGFDDARWLAERAPRPELPRRGVTSTQLGALEAEVAVDGSTIAAVRLVGDFIADSPGIEALEAGLRGCAAEEGAIGAVARRVLGGPEHFILGVGPLDTVVRTIVRGCAA